MEPSTATTSSPRRRKHRVSVHKLVSRFEGKPQEVDGKFLKPVASIQDFTVFTAQRRVRPVGWHSKVQVGEASSEAGSELGSEWTEEEGSLCATTDVPSGDDEEQTPRAKTPHARVPPLRFFAVNDEANKGGSADLLHLGRVHRVDEAEEAGEYGPCYDLREAPKKGANNSLGTSVQELTSSLKARVVLLSAAGGGVAVGSMGAAVGCASGGTVGVICGLAAAPLTLGASIPIGALAGSCTGFCAGAVGGSTAGSIGGGVLGLVGYRCHESGVLSTASRALPRFSLLDPKDEEEMKEA